MLHFFSRGHADALGAKLTKNRAPRSTLLFHTFFKFRISTRLPPSGVSRWRNVYNVKQQQLRLRKNDLNDRNRGHWHLLKDFRFLVKCLLLFIGLIVASNGAWTTRNESGVFTQQSRGARTLKDAIFVVDNPVAFFSSSAVSMSNTRMLRFVGASDAYYY